MASYRSFKELAEHEKEDRDYRIKIEMRDPRVLIMAPHGGKIEPTTGEIAEAIAGAAYSFYVFEGMKKDGNSVLHIESHLFDEPRALEIAGEAEIIVTIHGQLNQKDGFVMIGGLHDRLCLKVQQELETAGFQTRPPTEGLMGTDPQNICNRGKLKQGVQLEVSRKARDLLRSDGDQLRLFAEAMRRAIRMRGW